MSTPQVEYYREISAEDIRLIYAIVGVFSASIFIADVVYLVWGFDAYYEVATDDAVTCGNTFTINSGTYTADFQYDVKYLLVGIFCQILPIFVTLVMVVIKFSTDCVRGRPWKCLDESLGISFTTLIGVSTFLTFVFTTQVLSQYLQTTQSCLDSSSASYPIAANFIVGSFIFLYIALFLTIAGLIAMSTTFCCWRYCCCAYTPVPYPAPYGRREVAPLLPR